MRQPRPDDINDIVLQCVSMYSSKSKGPYRSIQVPLCLAVTQGARLLGALCPDPGLLLFVSVRARLEHRCCCFIARVLTSGNRQKTAGPDWG